MTGSQMQRTIATALSKQASTALGEAQIQSLAESIAQQIANANELRQLPDSVILGELEPTIQIMLAQDHSSITDAAQFAVQVLVTQVSDDPAIVVLPQFQDASFCPYPGLKAFEEHDGGLFFGRDLEIQYCISHLPQRLLAITGASGVGKSSLLQAGMIPHLRRAYGDKAMVLLFRASSSSNFIAEFAATLSRELALPARQVQHELESHNDALSSLLRPICAEPDRRVFLIIDQFEELFVHETATVQRCRFLDNLLSAVASPFLNSLSIILGSRKNFFEHRDYVARPALVDALERSAISLDTLTDAQLRQAIEQPLLKFNEAYGQAFFYQSGLVDVIVDDFRSQSSSLPLVQYLLRLLWVEKHRLSHFAYVSLGKLDRVLDRHASDIYRGFTDEQKPRVDGILLSLVGLGLEGEHTRKRLPYEEIVGSATDEVIVRRLSAPSSRIISERTVNGVEYLELTHEILLREWTILRALVEANRVRLKQRERLLVNADLWYGSRSQRTPNGDKGFLYQGTLYRQAKQYVESAHHPNSADSRILECFVASKRHRRQNAFVMIGVVVATAVIVVGIILGLQRQVADEQQRADVNATAQAVAQREAAVNATAQALAEEQARINEYARATAVAEAKIEQEAKVEEATLALSRRLAAAARSGVERMEIDLALLLSVEAYRRSPTVEAKASLFSALQTYPQLHKYLRQPQPDLPFVPLQFNPDSTLLASGELDGSVTLWDVSTGKVARRLMPKVQVSADEHLTLSARNIAFVEASDSLVYLDKTTTMWDLSSFTPSQQSMFPGLEAFDQPSSVPGAIAFAPGLRRIAISWPDSRSIEINTIGTDGMADTYEITESEHDIFFWDGITAMSFSTSGETLAIGLRNFNTSRVATAGLALWNVEKQEFMTETVDVFATSETIYIDCLALQDNRIYAVDASAASFIDNNPGQKPSEFSLTELSRFVGPIPSGQDISNGALRGIPPIKMFSSGCNIVLSPDGKYLASGNLVLWDLHSSGNLNKLLAFEPPFNLYDMTHVDYLLEVTLQFSEDSRSLLATYEVYDDTGIDLVTLTWDISSGELLGSQSTADRDRWYTELDRFTPTLIDERQGLQYTAMESPDRLEIRDLASGELIGEIPAVRARNLVLSPDGRYLASFGYPGNRFIEHPAHLTVVDIAEWIKMACEIANRDLTYIEWDQYLSGQQYRPTCFEK